MRSDIALFDLDRGEARSLLVLDAHVEAPNWLPDGGALIVNGGGRLFRVALDAPALEPIDTGFLRHLNNDHGVTPDGRTLIVSDSGEEGASAIYTLPIEGGTPRRVTARTPAYWHGVSPDGTTLAYVADRGSGYRVHTCPIEGGAERAITEGFDHCDGPDYSADGRWIWFNGERDARVALWRVAVEDGRLERMSDDDRVNWFPHPSPDGRHVLYLAYRPGVQGHPGGEHVELRLMPAEGGPPRRLLDVFGGQGTLNVPCWSPDGRRFAFVRYAA